MAKRKTDVATILALRRQGLTVKEVAAHLEVCYQTIYLYLNNQGRLRQYETTRRWQEEHPQGARDYRRQHSAFTKDRKMVYGITRRPRPETCELCRRNSRRLHYHHWNDEEIEVGLWLCTACHRLAEVVDKGAIEDVDKYLELKAAAATDLDREKELAQGMKTLRRVERLAAKLGVL